MPKPLELILYGASFLAQISVMGPIVDFQLVQLSEPSSASDHKFCCVYCTDSKNMMSACVMVLTLERRNAGCFI